MDVAILTCCMVLVFYHHIGYPALLRWFARRLRQNARGQAKSANNIGSDAVDRLSSVGLLISAHNEERVIRRKLINCSEIDYPEDKLTILIALDGCTDDTERVLRETLLAFPSLTVRTFVFEVNQGKIGVLNRVIPEVQVDIMGLSDASALLDPEAIKRGVSHFSHPGLGVVCGTYEMPIDASKAERAYWRYQVEIKADEAVVAAPMGAHGAFYLFRRALWKPLEPDTINDDFVLPMRMVAAGWTALYDRQIVATELEAANSRQDFRRRVRIGAGNLQQTLRLWRLASLTRPRLAFVFLSGKSLRSFMPFIILVAFVASCLLAYSGGVWWQALLGLEIAIVLLVVVGTALPKRVPRIVDLLSYWAMGYIASGLGALLLLSGHANSAWRISKIGRASGSSSHLVNQRRDQS